MDSEKAGEKIGFVLMFFVSTIILFFILKILNKLPENWSYVHIVILVLLITLVGISIKRILR